MAGTPETIDVAVARGSHLAAPLLLSTDLEESRVATIIVPEQVSLEADYAITVNARGRLDEQWSWTAWKTHKWPADIIRPQLLIYGFDLRKEKRELTAL